MDDEEQKIHLKANYISAFGSGLTDAEGKAMDSFLKYYLFF